VVRKSGERLSSLIILRKIIYLISPKKFYKSFYQDLESVLNSKRVKYFQLRFKNEKKYRIIRISKKIKKITQKHKVKFIINDKIDIAKIVNADGCHLGQKDGSILEAKKYFKRKILGITCHGSKSLAKKAIKDKASYLAFGSFNQSKLKPKASKAKINILKWAKKNVKKPIVAIGGIDNLNYARLIKNGANYIAISSYIWDNPKLKPDAAIREFK